MIAHLAVPVYRVSVWGDFSPAFIGKVYCITIIAILCRPKMAQTAFLDKMDREAARIGVGTNEKHSASQGLGATSSSRCRSCGTVTAVGLVSMRSGGGGTPRLPMSPDLAIIMKEGPVGFKAALLGVQEDEEEAKHGNVSLSLPGNEGLEDEEDFYNGDQALIPICEIHEVPRAVHVHPVILS